MIEINNRISIQVGLSGYSFKIQTDNGCDYSGWRGADTIFVTPEFQKRYSDVEISVFTPYCTLVPQDFHRPESSKELLSEVVKLPEGAVVDYVAIPELASVMIYSNNIGGTLHKVLGESVLKVDGSKSKQLPELYYMLRLEKGTDLCMMNMEDRSIKVISKGTPNPLSEGL